MNRLAKMAVAAALAGVTASASAWWGGPFNGWGNDWFGNGGFDFNFSMGVGGHGASRYYDAYGPWGYPYGAPYWGGYAPPVYGYPYAAPLTPEQQAALNEQQKAFAEQQAKLLQQAVEAQRQFAQRLPKPQGNTAGAWPVSGNDPLSSDPFATDLPQDFKAMMEQSDAAYQQAKDRNQARREAYRKQVEERRELMKTQRATPEAQAGEQKAI